MILGIYGFGGLGHEVLELAQEINQAENRWERFVLIDDSVEMSKDFKGIEVLPFTAVCETYSPEQIEITVAVGEPTVREKLWIKIESNGFSSPALIHPAAQVSRSAEINSGCTISFGSYISCDVKIECNTFLQPYCSLGHNCVVGSHSVLSTFVTLAGGVQMGRGSYIGMSVPVRENVSIGEYSIIGMGSVVLRDVPDNVIAMGNPARVLKKNESGRVFS